MWSTTWALSLLLLQVLVISSQDDSEFNHGDAERSNFSTRFRHYRMGLGGLFPSNMPPNGCKCHRDPVLPEEIICACRGQGVKEFKANLTRGVTRLSLESISITVLKAGVLQMYKESLRDLVLDRLKELTEIEDRAFYGLHLLRTISIKQAPKLKHIQDAVFNCHLPNLKIIRIIQSGLETIPNLQYVDTKSIIYMVDLDSNKINHVPSGSVKMKTEMLNLDFNLIRKIESKAFEGSEIAKLSLKGNSQLEEINEEAFYGLKNVRTLDLSDTNINYLPIKGLEELEILRLSDVYPLKVFPSVYHFKYIKEAHLTYPYHCCAFKFPATHDPEEFSKYVAFKENMEKMYCKQNPTTPVTKSDDLVNDSAFRRRRRRELHVVQSSKILKDDSGGRAEYVRSHNRMYTLPRERHWKHKQNGLSIKKTTLQRGTRMIKQLDLSLTDNQINSFKQIMDFPNSSVKDTSAGRTDEWGGIPKLVKPILYPDDWFNASDTEDFFSNQLFAKRRNPKVQKNLPDNPFEGVFHGTTVAVISEVELEAFCGQLSKNYRDVECFPSPDAFNPCEDVMGNMLLRVVVWIVVITSVMGNVAVMVVLLSTGACNSVSKFLMCNLAFADFCMGCYLLTIAAMDLHSMGTYFNYAIDWQHGYGCQIAGFLTVFATELSIYTLTVISVERRYAITYAINLNKRLKLRRAANIMSVGWIFALTMAFLPLVNVNGYSRTSICLPMKNQHLKDVVYLMVLIITNSLAFVFIFFCYANMYISVIRHQSRATANDMAVAKRMALLVITDFLCWAPVAFFAATAVAGFPLIDVTKSKILLVFFYPLNSCANPFLYAIFTTQYRRDFLILLRRCDCCNDWTRGGKKHSNSDCNVPPLQFSTGKRHWNQANSYSSQVSTDNSMKVLRPSDLSSQQDVFSTSGWEDQDVEDVIQLFSNVCTQKDTKDSKDSISSEDSGQYCKNYSSSSHSTTTHRGSPHPVKNRFVHPEKSHANILDIQTIHTTSM